MAGSAVFALAYAIGSAAGSTVTGFAMDLGGPPAGPISVGLVLLTLAALLGLSRR